MTRRRYYAEYWRNDGEFHVLEYDLTPAYVFQAKNDEEALTLALAYIRVNREHKEDFWLMKLAELNIKMRPVKTNKRVESIVKSEDLSNLEKNIKKAKFKDLEDVLSPR